MYAGAEPTPEDYHHPKVPVSLRKSIEIAETPIQVSRTYQYTIAPAEGFPIIISTEN